MRICGVKLTHDAAIAMLDDDQLVFSVEIEKLNNNPRYSSVGDTSVIADVLHSFGYDPSVIDEWAVDGWDGRRASSCSVTVGGRRSAVELAPYRESEHLPDVLAPGLTSSLQLDSRTVPYVSYTHVSGHIASAYCTSPFAALGEPSLVMVWDGGLFPRLYDADSDGRVRSCGPLFPMIGHAYATAAHHFGPYRRADEAVTVDDLSVAGKLMAYIALGTPRPDVVALIGDAFHEHFEADTPSVKRYREAIGGFGSNAEPSLRYVHSFFRDIARRVASLGLSDEDVLASVHAFLEQLLVERLVQAVRHEKGSSPVNLCIVGGCALNIKWNSAIRDQAVFRAVWVPPFPNDSGSAIGVASAHAMATTGLQAIRWDTYSGPPLQPSDVGAHGWSANPCSPEQLAAHLHGTGRPVIVLYGRAELGPRALGRRSILAPAVDPAMKDELNKLKDRESYRPVAPVCLEQHAPRIFAPGTRDPHMLFEHVVREEWVGKIPAVLHVDGTARLQTVNEDEEPVLAAILTEYERLSGIPVLCNTSANYHGRGFFPDIASAMSWGRVEFIWSESVLYSRPLR